MKIKYKDTITKKIIILFFITIVLQIPILFIKNIIYERKYLYDETVENIGKEWGEKQTLAGPFLILKTKELLNNINSDEEKVNNESYSYYIVLPNNLKTNIKMEDDVKKRGIYKSIVYNSNVNISGDFENVKTLLPESVKIEKAYFAMGLSDTKSLMKIKNFNLENQEIKTESGTGLSYGLLRTGISGEIDSNIIENNNFKFNVSFDSRGSEGVEVLPFGNSNEVFVESTWNSPSFNGILPDSKNITKDGFNASWNVTSFVRNYKQVFKYADLDEELEESKMNVNLFNTVTHYTQITRAIKYSMLFIMLTIFVVYLFEVLSKKITHYVQYGVVGFSLVMFYLLLLSLSEYFSFELSYLVASLMVVIPNSLYIKSMTNNKKFGVGIFLFLSGIYIILFSILRLEQYALLTGTLLLMLVLYIIMYLTRNMKKLMIYQEEVEKETINIEKEDEK